MPSTLPTLDNTWGAALLGLVFASVLYGITTLQVFIYFTHYPNDARRLKLLAAVVWILDSASLALVCNAMYGYLVTDMANPFNRIAVNRSLDIDPAIMGILAFLTHGYLGTRVWRVCNKNNFLGAVLIILSLTALCLALVSSVVSFRFHLWTEKVSIKPLALAGTIIVVFLDVLIASILCVYILRQDAHGKDVRKLLRRVVIFSINTGLASSILSTINIVTFLEYPDTMIFLGSNFIFTKVYANCLLANLNVRESLRGTVRNDCQCQSLSLNLSALHNHPPSTIIYHVPEDSSQPSAHLTILSDNSKYESSSSV